MHRTFAIRVVVLLMLLLGSHMSWAGLRQPAPDERLHALWDELLQLHVTPEGFVNYQGFLEDEDKLLAYLLAQRKVTPDPATWSAAEIEAYWINIYNAATVYMVLQHYPLGSVNDIRVKGRTHSPWETPNIIVGGQEYSLNQIEREKLSARFHDPRIHFALVQAAVSGPVLLNEAYAGSQLPRQLEQQTRRFVNDPTRNPLAGPQPQASSLFSFYASEFGSRAQLVEFLNRYTHTPLPASAAATLGFLPFSWALNDRPVLSGSQALSR